MSLTAIAVAFTAAPAGCISQGDRGQEVEPEEVLEISARAEGDFVDTDEAYRLFQAKLPELKRIQREFEEELLKMPGVSSIGISLDEDGFTPVFLVFITDPELMTALPSRVKDVPLKVRLGGPVELMDGGPGCNGGAGPPCHHEPQLLPVEMGNSGAWRFGPICTMGFKACDPASGREVLVTNSHCAQDRGSCNLASINDPFVHPAPLDEIHENSLVTIGTISGHAAPSCGAQNNDTDATKVTSSIQDSSRTLRDIGAPKHEFSNPMPHWTVQYSARTSGFNMGPILAVNVSARVPAENGFCCGDVMMRDQISFEPQLPILRGDSGSGVLLKSPRKERDRRIVGLFFAADNVAGVGYFNNIDRVLSALELTFDFTPCGGPPID